MMADIVFCVHLGRDNMEETYDTCLLGLEECLSRLCPEWAPGEEYNLVIEKPRGPKQGLDILFQMC